MKALKLKPLSILIFGLIYSNTTSAGGLFLYEIATPDAGLSAAGLAARAQDAATAQSNPAGMTRLKGKQLMYGAQLLVADMHFETGSDTTTIGNNGGNPVGLLPAASLFYVHPLSENLRLGYALYSNFGSLLKYNDDWVGRYHVQQSTLIGATFSPSLAYRLSPHWSAGIGLNLMYTLFRIQTAINTPLDLGDGQVIFKDTDLTVGGQLSLLFEASKCTRFGLVYNSPMNLTFNNVPQFSNLGSLASILNTNHLNSELTLNMTVPQSLMLSGFHEINSHWAALSSIGWQNWSQFGLVSIELDASDSTTLTVNQNYQDTWHGSIGLQYKTNGRFGFSTGLAYDSSIVDTINRIPSTPVGQTWRVGLGVQYALSKQSTMHFCYTLNWAGNMGLDRTGGPLSGMLEGIYPNTAIHFFGLSYQNVF